MSNKYDAILLALGIVMLAMGAGILLSPKAAIAAGLVGVAIAGYAMFGIPPK